MNIPNWLNFYDIFGYIFPGAIIVGAAAVLTAALFKGIDFHTDEVSTAEWALLPFVAYLAGIAVQGLGHRFETAANKRIWGDWPSRAFMSGRSDRYSKPFREGVKQAVADVYGIPEEEFAKDGFWLCYSFVVQRGFGQRVEVFLGRSALSRGLVVACLIGGIALLLAAAVDTALPPLLGSVALFLAVPAFFDRWRRSTASFADAVYRDFYVAHHPREDTPNAP
jgi:hypothetical protein